MYEAMRDRAPNSTQAIGASVTVLVLALTGYAAMTGIGRDFVAAMATSTTIVTLPPKEDVAPREPLDPVTPTETIKLPQTKLLAPEFPVFVPDPGDRVIGEPATGPRRDPVASSGGTVIAPLPALKAPKLRLGELPPYPARDIRARNEGVSGIEVCVDARGRVTAANLIASSGHAGLDDAALKWIRTARFDPATRGGSPEAVCGHGVDYEWRLVDARR